jgi:hypothetical protein
MLNYHGPEEMEGPGRLPPYVSWGPESSGGCCTFYRIASVMKWKGGGLC